MSNKEVKLRESRRLKGLQPDAPPAISNATTLHVDAAPSQNDAAAAIFNATAPHADSSQNDAPAAFDDVTAALVSNSPPADNNSAVAQLDALSTGGASTSSSSRHSSPPPSTSESLLTPSINTSSSDPVSSETNLFPFIRLPPDTDSEEDNDDNMTSKISLPDFNVKKPETWFVRIEGILTTNKITDNEAKFWAVVGSLDDDTLDLVMDKVKPMPDNNKYETLKKTIIDRTAASTDKKLLEAMSGLTLGDQKPSQLWRQLKDRAGDTIGDEALRVRWLDLLPKNVAMLLEVLDTKDMAKLTASADKIMAMGGSIMAVGPTRPYSREYAPQGTTTSTLEDQVAKLQAAVAQLSTLVLQSNNQQQQQQCYHRPQQNQRSRSRSRSRGRSATPGAPTWCWYHRTHGSAAVKCAPGCTFSSQQEN